MKLHIPLRLRKCLLALMTVATAVTCHEAQAGVMHEDASFQTYADFGQNKGRYVTGNNVNALLQHIRNHVDGGIAITYTDGTDAYIITNEQGMINFAATDDIGAQVAVSPTFAATVLHNGSINASYGSRVVGNAHSINYAAIDIRGSSVFRLAPDNGSGSQYDYMLQRQNKIVTDAVWNPVTEIRNMESLSGDLVYHSGAGGMGLWTEAGGKKGLAGAYTYIIGGINTITSAQTHAGATNTSIHQNPNYGNGVGASAENPLPNAIQGGDSGSPIFIYNEETQQYEYLAAQQSGGGNSYGQARGNVEWTHTTLESFNERVSMQERDTVTLTAVTTEGETKSDGTHSTVLYSGTVQDADGNTLATYNGVKSGEHTWAALNDIRDVQNWYAYDAGLYNASNNTDGKMLKSAKDLFFTENLVFEAKSPGVEKNIVLADTVDLGVGYAEFHGAKYIISSESGASHQFNHAGYVINEGAEVHLRLVNPENYMTEWRKNGAGDLYIDGTGNTHAMLNVGGSGTTYLQQKDGYAAYNVLANAGATVVIDNVGQIVRDFTFGSGGGVLDMNGNSMDWYTTAETTNDDARFSINALTEGAIIANSKGESTLVYKEGGNTTYLGSFRDSEQGSLKIDYQGNGEWTLHSIHTDLSHHADSEFVVSNGHVKLVGTITEHGMGSLSGTNQNRIVVANDWHYADAAMDVTVKDGATFELGSHARLAGDVTVENGGTFLLREGVQNRYEHVEGGALLEDTYQYADFWGLKGDIQLQGAMRVEYSEGANTLTTLAGNISGNGALTVDLGIEGGTLLLSGDNAQFTGEKRVESGRVITANAAALGNSSTNQWKLDTESELIAHGISLTQALSHVSGESTGTLSLTADTAEAADMSAHATLYLGAEEGKQVQYGAASTVLSAQAGAWRLGGGGGNLVLRHRLTGDADLLLGASAHAQGTVTLGNANNDFSGDVIFNSRHIVLAAEDGALGSARVHLDYGNRMQPASAAALKNVESDSAGMLLVDRIGSAQLDLTQHQALSLAAGADTTFRGSIALAEGAGYQLGAASGATLTIQSSLDATRALNVDAQGYEGGKVVLAGNGAWQGDITVRGSMEESGGGTIALVAGQDMQLSGAVNLHEGGSFDLGGHIVTLSTSQQGHGGSFVNSGETGSLVFDTQTQALQSAASVQVTNVRKVGSHNLSLGGNNSFTNLYVDGGTLTLSSNTATSSGSTVHLAEGTQINTANHALKSNVLLQEGVTAGFTAGGNHVISGSVYGGRGSTLVVDGGKLRMQTPNALSFVGTLKVQNDVNLISRGGAGNMTRNFEHVHINGGKLTLSEGYRENNTNYEWNASTIWNIASLSGQGVLQWNSFSKHDTPSVLRLSGNGEFNGEIVFNRTFDASGGTHSAFLELKSDMAAGNTTLSLSGNHTNGVASLAIATQNAHIKGLTGNAHTFVFAGTAPAAANIRGTSRPATTQAATLSIDTAAGKEYTFAGAVGNSTDTAAAGLSLVKTGAGTQNFTGATYLQDVAVYGGTLSFSNENIMGNVGVGYGATLSGVEYVLSAGKRFTVLGGEAGASTSAKLVGNLVLAGGELALSGKALATAQQQGQAALSLGGISAQEGASGHTVSVIDYFSLTATDYTIANGDWSSLAESLSLGDMGIYTGALSVGDGGALKLAVSLKENVQQWQEGASFHADKIAYFTEDATITVAANSSAQALALGHGVELTTDKGIQLSGALMAGDDTRWILASGAQQTLAAGSYGALGTLEVTDGAQLTITGVATSGTSDALDNVAGSGTVVLNYNVSGNGTAFDFSRLTGEVQLQKGRILVSSSQFGETAPTLVLASGNSQLVFNGTNTVLNSAVRLDASTTIHVNNGKTGTMAGVVSGTGNFTKAGSGTLTFAAANTYTGTTQITGTLQLDLAAGNGTGGDYTLHGNVSGGTLAVQEHTTLQANGKNINSALQLQGAHLVVSNGNTSISGAVTGEDVSITLGRYGEAAYTDGGTLTFNGKVDVTGKMEVGAGKAVFAYTGADGNKVSAIDAGLAGRATGQVVVNSGASLDVAESIWLSSEDGGTAGVEIKQGGKLSHAGLNIHGVSAEQDASLKAHTARGLYTTQSANFTIAHALVEKSVEGNLTVGNRLERVALQNSAAGKLIVSNAASSYTDVYAMGGDISVLNKSNLTLNQLAIAGGNTVSVRGGANESTAVSTVTVNEVATFAEGSHLQANLKLAEGSALNMSGSLTLGGNLQLASGQVLSGAVYETLYTLGTGQAVVLFEGLSGVQIHGESMAADSLTLSAAYAANLVFSNVSEDVYLIYNSGENGEPSTLSLYLSAALNAEEMQVAEVASLNAVADLANADSFAGFVAYNGSVALVPEPTTATLSLVALMALAARRRRK